MHARTQLSLVAGTAALIGLLAGWLAFGGQDREIVTITARALGWSEDSETPGFEVEWRNRSSARIRVAVDPEFFRGRIYITDGDEVQVAQEARFYTSLRVGIRPTKDVWLEPGGTYRQAISLDNLVGPDGEKTAVRLSGGSSIFCITGDAWIDSADEPHLPAVILSEIPLNYSSDGSPWPGQDGEAGAEQPATQSRQAKD